MLRGLGCEHARLLRIVLLAYTRWPGRQGHAPWPSNATLSARCCLDERQIERSLAALREAGLVSTRFGRRTGATRPVGRLIDLGLHAPCKAIAPGPMDISNLWRATRSARPRPASLVTAMVGAYMLACDGADARPIDDWADLGCTMSDWRRFIGHADNPAWTRRVRDLDDLGLIRRDGRTVFVSPPRAWFSLVVEHARAGRIYELAPPVRLLRIEEVVEHFARTGT